MSKRRKVTRRVVKEKSDACPSCKLPMEEREHIAVLQKQLNQPFYYSKWFRCMNKDCRTKSVMKDEFKVFNKNAGGFAEQERVELEGQTSFLKSI